LWAALPESERKAAAQFGDALYNLDTKLPPRKFAFWRRRVVLHRLLTTHTIKIRRCKDTPGASDEVVFCVCRGTVFAPPAEDRTFCKYPTSGAASKGGVKKPGNGVSFVCVTSTDRALIRAAHAFALQKSHQSAATKDMVAPCFIADVSSLADSVEFKVDEVLLRADDSATAPIIILHVTARPVSGITFAKFADAMLSLRQCPCSTGYVTAPAPTPRESIAPAVMCSPLASCWCVAGSARVAPAPSAPATPAVATGSEAPAALSGGSEAVAIADLHTHTTPGTATAAAGTGARAAAAGTGARAALVVEAPSRTAGEAATATSSAPAPTAMPAPAPAPAPATGEVPASVSTSAAAPVTPTPVAPPAAVAAV